MSARWPLVRLGEVLRHRKQFITIDDTVTYRRPRVQLHAQGIVLRDQVPGALIKTKQQQVCCSGEFLVAEIDAKIGGFGLVPPEMDGAIVSSHYFLFEVDARRLDRQFLGWFCRTPAFREQVEAQGTTNYAAIRPAHVLGYGMPLPPLPEQQRIVARLDAVAEGLAAREAAAKEADAELDALLTAAFTRLTEGAPRVSMGEVAPLKRRPIPIRIDGSYPELGIRSFGKGTFHKPALSGAEVGSKRLFRIEPGDLRNCSPGVSR